MRRLLVTQRVVLDGATGEFRDALDTRWAPFLAGLGFAPILVPSSITALDAWLDAVGPVAGVLLTGGNDLATLDDAEANQRRERLERALLERTVGPVIGVCRGMQLLASLDGFELSRTDGHVRTRHRLLVDASATAAWAAYSALTVNSFHGYAVRGAGRTFSVCARTEDGGIEAISSADGRRVGIMWHPEREEVPVLADRQLFERVLA